MSCVRDEGSGRYVLTGEQVDDLEKVTPQLVLDF